MSSPRTQCFVCGKTKTVGVFQLIEGCIVPGTFKPIKDILKYFEKIINHRLDLTPNSTACRDCLEYLFNYDRLVRNLSQVQRQIADALLSCRKKKPGGQAASAGKETVRREVVKARVPTSVSSCKIINSTPAIKKRKTQPQRQKESPPEMSSEMKDTEYKDEFQEEFQTIMMDDDTIQVLDPDQEDFHFSDLDDSVAGVSSESDIEEALDIPCHICGEIFTSQDNLERHIKTDNCQKNEYATCNICGLKVKDDEVLDLHMNLHEGKTELECRYCLKKFSHKRNVLRHMEVHWDKKKYQCDKCGERFSLSWLMYNHLMRHDAEENALICETCHQQFKTKRTYKHHLRTHQTDRPRYQCTDCDKSFVDKYTLKVHKRVHMPAEPDSQVIVEVEVKDFHMNETM
ncbi:serendipity locus protein beta [Drosophila tropicalis]|uniref:serendipity locus protein beta n=1 Tax=Drosophila tropicalis TaxID=46794 RepID=UPI0035ABC5A2